MNGSFLLPLPRYVREREWKDFSLFFFFFRDSCSRGGLASSFRRSRVVARPTRVEAAVTTEMTEGARFDTSDPCRLRKGREGEREEKSIVVVSLSCFVFTPLANVEAEWK